MAALGVPLVCSVHSIVGLDFAASLMPGWNEGIFPPYFVVGAMYSGFGMVIVLALAISLGAQRFRRSLPANHFEVMGKNPADGLHRDGLFLRDRMVHGDGTAASTAIAASIAFQFTGSYAPLFWALLFCNVLLPQALWFPAVRRSLPALFVDRRRHQYRHVAGAHS